MRRWLPCCVLFLVSIAAGAFAAPGPRGPILVLGDSLSAAYGIPPESGWVRLLARRLEERRVAHETINASISGETTGGGLARLPPLLASHAPALVLVELGANDALQGQPIASIRANLAAIILACREAGAGVLLVGTEIPVNYGPQYRDTLRSMYQGLAEEFKLPLVPFLLEGIAMDPDLMQPDGLHPVAAAQPAILERVWPVLEPLLGATPEKASAPPEKQP